MAELKPRRFPQLPPAPAKLLSLLLVAVAMAAAAPSDPPSPSLAAQTTASGFDHFYSLEYVEAEEDFNRVCQLEPGSAAAWNHLAEARLYREMYRVGALESELYGHGDPFLATKQLPTDPDAVADFLSAVRRSSELASAQLASHPDDAGAHYNLAIAWAMRGTYEFTLAKSFLAALSDARKARAQAARALALQPDLVDAELILGVHNYVAGSLPWTAKVFTTLADYRGDREKGLRQIEYVATHGGEARVDANVLLAVIDRRDGRNEQAAAILAQLSERYPRNVLFAVETAEASEAAGEHARAQRDYQLVLDRALHHEPGYSRAPLDKVWYDLGDIEALESRWPQALADFRQSEDLADARPYYRQAAALAAGECDDRMGDATAAQREYLTCVTINPDSPAAQEARRRMHP